MTVFIRGRLSVLHIHVPKTGGGSILNLFKRNGFAVEFCDLSSIVTDMNALRTCSPQHYHAALLQASLRLNRLTYVFMTARHPLDRLKSEFLWRVRDPAVNANAWAKHILSVYARDAFILDNHIRPQHEFMLDGAEVFRIEDGFGHDWVARIGDRLGVDLDPGDGERANVALDYCGRSIADVSFNDCMTAEVVRFYSRDFDAFGYDRSS